MERVLRWYTGYLEERGTVADVPEWNPLDWASVFVSGRSSILTALWARGLLEFAELVRRWEEFLVDGYDTCGECWGWGTPVHGWSSTPTRDLICYVLGITSANPGYRRVASGARLGRLQEAAGAVPTPHGSRQRSTVRSRSSSFTRMRRDRAPSGSTSEQDPLTKCSDCIAVG